MVDQNKRDRPYSYIMKAIELLKSQGMNKVIEIGCARGPLNHPVNEYHHICCNDGHSTALFASAGLEVTSIDINPNSVNYAKEILNRHATAPFTVLCMDGLKYIENNTEDIHLLFLDAWDLGTPNSAENHLEAYKIANKKMTIGSLLLVDDTDIDDINGELFLAKDLPGGKGKLLYTQAIKDGYIEIFKGRQTLMRKSI